MKLDFQASLFNREHLICGITGPTKHTIAKICLIMHDDRLVQGEGEGKLSTTKQHSCINVSAMIALTHRAIQNVTVHY